MLLNKILNKIDWFIFSLFIVLILSYLFPQGCGSGFFSLETYSKYGVSLIFFFYGLKLTPGEMIKGISNYKLHLLVQITTFLIFPLITISAKPLFFTDKYQLLWMSLFFLSVLPSTVSSSVVMVSLAKGNIPGAIFNAGLSGLIGIIITPLWIGFYFNNVLNDFDLSVSIISLLIRILLPLILGLLLSKYFRVYTYKYNKYLTVFDKSVILSIVYNSFSKSFSNDVFSDFNLFSILLIILLSIVLFFAVYGIVYFISGKLNFSVSDRITALFCGSKKSLVHATVFSSVIFNGISSQGIFLLAIMIYHPFQLFVVSYIAQKYGKRG